MKIHLITHTTLKNFVRSNKQSEVPIANWLRNLKYVSCDKPEDIKKSFPSIDFLGRGTNRVVFDIGGNKYRLIAEYHFGEKWVHIFICWIGTHAEYSKLCNEKKQYSISNY